MFLTWVFVDKDLELQYQLDSRFLHIDGLADSLIFERTARILGAFS